MLAGHMSYYYLTTIEKKTSPNKKVLIRTPLNRNEREFQTFYIRPRSGTDSEQWDWGITYSTCEATWWIIDLMSLQYYCK